MKSVVNVVESSEMSMRVVSVPTQGFATVIDTFDKYSSLWQLVRGGNE